MARTHHTRQSWLVSVLILLSLFTVTISCQAEQDKKKIILLETMSVPAVLEASRWFKMQLSEMGYTQGENLDLVLLKAQGDRKLAEKLLQTELDKYRPDLVVTNATLASQAAAALLHDSDIPILFFTVSDPVGAGLISRLGVAPGGNITGKVHTLPRGIKLDLVLRLLGKDQFETPVRIGIIHSSYPSAMGDVKTLHQLADQRGGLEIISHQIPYQKGAVGLANMIEASKVAVAELRHDLDFWWEASGPLAEVPEYTRILLDNSEKPILFGNRIDSVKMGALLSLSPDQESDGRDIARLADAILKGAEAGKIPVVPPANTILALNLATALDMKIVIPADLMELAGDHIYR